VDIVLTMLGAYGSQMGLSYSEILQPNSGLQLSALLCPRPGGIKRWYYLTSVCLTSVWRRSRTSGRRAACVAGRLDGAYWLIGPGSAGLAQGCRYALPLQAWVGHIVAAARPPTACYASAPIGRRH